MKTSSQNQVRIGKMLPEYLCYNISDGYLVFHLLKLASMGIKNCYERALYFGKWFIFLLGMWMWKTLPFLLGET